MEMRHRGGAGEHHDIGERREILAAVVKIADAAEAWLGLGEHHPSAGHGCRFGGGKAARTTADHQHVAVDADLLVGGRVAPGRGAAEAGGAADQRLIEMVPEAFRPFEGLVVEAAGNEAREQVVDLADVEGKARPAVLAHGCKPVMKLNAGRLQIGLVRRPAADADQCVHLLGAQADNAARPVIFEAASDEALAVGEKSGGKGVAGKALEPAAVEGEGERLPAIDQPADAGSLGQAVGRWAGHIAGGSSRMP
jgi:hypothetical protein